MNKAAHAVLLLLFLVVMAYQARISLETIHVQTNLDFPRRWSGTRWRRYWPLLAGSLWWPGC
jgi:hypothetical protein